MSHPAAAVDHKTVDDSDAPTPLRIQRKRDLTAGEIATVNVSNKKDFQKRFRVYKLDVELHQSSLSRLTYWRVFDPATGTVRTCGFDVDMERLLAQLEAGKSFERIDLYKGTRFVSSSPSSTSGPVGTRLSDERLVRCAALCVICGEPGGLPCPAMVKEALTTRFVLAVPLDSPAVAVHKHVHPGRCRKRLRAHLDAARAARRNLPGT